MAAPDIKEALTRKIGPLPAWGWGVALGGGFLVWRYMTGGGSSGQQAAQPQPTFPVASSQLPPTDYLSQILASIRAVEQNTAPPAIDDDQSGSGNGNPVPPPDPVDKLGRTVPMLQGILWATIDNRPERLKFAASHRRTGPQGRESVAQAFTRLFGRPPAGVQATAIYDPTPEGLGRRIQEARATSSGSN